jgi:uncharacterized protein (DUF433 family)
MTGVYVEQRFGTFHLTGSRVTLDSIVFEFLRGESPEAIARSFPSLTLEQVYGAITYYLANRTDIDAYLAERESRFLELAIASRDANPLLYSKLDISRRLAAGIK